MNAAQRPESPRKLPAWLTVGVAAVDGFGRRGIVRFVGEWRDPSTRRVVEYATFLRPEGGGTEWMVEDPHSLTPAR
jgi:hypothetical protein